MIDWLQVVTLAIIQGLTEFLPISSSAHLILLPKIFQWSDQGLSFDIAVHAGTLLAVVCYFQNDLKSMFNDTLVSLKSRQATSGGLLASKIILATLPVGFAGLVFHDFVANHLRSSTIIAISTIVFGLCLWFSDSYSKKNAQAVSYRQALLIGIAQAIALIPGTSRSGITLTAGLALGLNRHMAARFSFLMAIPVITLAMLLEIKNLLALGTPQPWMVLGIGILISAFCAYLCIHFFLKLLDNLGVAPFVIYRLLLGVFLLYFL